MFSIKYEQGRFFLVAAENLKEALQKIVEDYPELATADLLDAHITSDVYEL